MRIGGLQKTTLLDFPGKVSAIVFTQGCNFTCPYCHNSELAAGRQEGLSQAGVMAFLEKRRNVLKGVVISGGEPTLHEGLSGFCASLKDLGYAVKLDTNGSRPEVLRELLMAGLLDYVAMDVKADPEDYPAAICSKATGGNVRRSMALLEESGVRHEFRIPCVAPFIDTYSFAAILGHIRKATLFLQAVRAERVLQADFFARQGRALDKNEMEILSRTAAQKNVDCRLR
ncbi:MAG: anaerobic ribonucleoside-triphosphate reductase activating protein [Desulfovibrionaceae bacterium]|nr:anaerobic ribonucleoside-triphosphate reductase activating protein [Desulfovibrionaceae bacterium]